MFCFPGTIEWFGLEGTLQIISFQPPAMGRDTFHQTRLLKAPSHLALNTAREWAATASLDNLCQCLTTVLVKKFLPCIQSKSTLPQFKAITHVLLLQTLLKVFPHLSYKPALKYWKASMKSLWSLLFSRLNNPNSLSLSSQQRGSSPRIIFVASSGPSPTCPCLSCAEGSRAGCRTPGGISSSKNAS